MKNFIVYLDDMLDAIEKGISFVKDLNLSEFSNDDKLNLQ